ncbi:olfactory receptor 2F1-like [Polypterus senegalus]|uniref:olfactory receptor 2F1-like n=1 Tax=Polypterus senegalus TaxID=55291 RepID=UPI0019647BA8|nr:olfactory receptor 2F1-like [Polypterus senegalus]
MVLCLPWRHRSREIPFMRSYTAGMNQTSVSVSEFILHCTVDSKSKSYTIAILTVVYLVTLFGNCLVLRVIAMNPQLQNSMFAGIAALAIIDVVGSTNIIPRLISILSGWVAIPYGACLLQLLLSLYLGGAESFLLAFMACDRYVAVLHPLRYSTLVTKRVIWAAACNENPKYFDIMTVTSFVFGICPFVFVLLSYARIAYAALKISSLEGKKKTLNTVATHLLVVALFNVPLLIAYMLTGAGVKLSVEANNAMIIVAVTVPPMFNPIIYSFRNKEIRSSIQKLFKRA